MVKKSIIMAKRILFLSVIALFAVCGSALGRTDNDSIVNDSVLLQRALMYRYGINKDVDLKKAANIYKRLAHKGNSDAMTQLGELFLNGEGVETNRRNAFNLFRKAAEDGNAEAMCKLARMYQVGIGVKQNFAKAFYYYSEAAALDYPQGYYGAGYLLYKGLGVKQDYNQAEQLLKRGASLKHPGCDFLLGVYYASDYNKDPDYEKAKQHYNKAVKGGHGWTVDLTKYNKLDSIMKRNSSRSKLKSGLKWKNKLQWTLDAELNDITVDSLCGRWTGRAYIYDWSGNTVTDEEPIELRIERGGNYYTMEWLRNDTIFLKFQPEYKDGNVWKSTRVDNEYLKTYPWAISKLIFGMTKDNQLFAHIQRLSVSKREPMRPVVALLKKMGLEESSEKLFKIDDISPNPLRGNRFQVAISCKTDVEISVSIYNTAGAQVAKCGLWKMQKGINRISVNASLGKGQYVLRVTGNGHTETRNIIHL